MSCNTTDDVRIIMKYSTISGATPSIPLSDNHEDGTWLPTDLYIGEFFTNAADDTFYIRTDNGIHQLFGGTGGSSSFIGDFVSISGGTFSGVVYAPTFSADYLVGTTINGTTITADYFIGGTYSGDGSLLTGIVSNWLGGTISNPSYFTNTVDFTNNISFDGLIGTNNPVFSFDNNMDINGYASASIFYGDGSGLTNLPTGTYSDTFTIGATLSSNTIIFSRNDSIDYSIDLSPILNQQTITTITWDDTIDQLLITFNDASTIGLTINNFSQVSSTGPITAPEFYGGVFYGEFVGTYSNDIYTLTADLIGTNQIFTRTDGSTYSTDLSSLAGGATPSLSDVLNTGNTTGTYSIIVEDQSALTSTSGESNILFTPVGIDMSIVNMTFSNYEINDGSSSSREIGEIGLTNSSTHLQTYYGINNGVTSTSGDRNLSVNISNSDIISNVTEISTGFNSNVSQRWHEIGTNMANADNSLTEYKRDYEYSLQIANNTLDKNTYYLQNEESILDKVTDNGFSYISSNELKVQNHQRRFSPTPNIFITEDKRGYWTQTLDATPQIVAYADVDPSAMVTNTSIVQVKAMVRGILSDKSLGYAAEITSWVRLDELGPTPIVQIGTVDYTIKSEFTTASSSFVISGPNMYIDVTGEIGLTIDWTCSLEIIYDKNTF